MPHSQTRKKTGISKIPPEPKPQPKPEPKKAEPAPPLQDGPITRVLGPVDRWLTARVDWLVWLIVAIGFYLRLDLARGTYLNGDETQIMFPALQHGWMNVYRAAMAMPYGPVGFFLLHVLTFFGGSEAYYRMPSVIAGALVPYVAYRWAAETFGKGAGLAAACILGFSPALVILSAQVRHYMIHTLLMACSLYCLERAFRDQSARWLRLFGAFLLVALLTMYMSVWYTAAIGLYALLRILKRGFSPRLVKEWVAIQLAAVGLLAIAYATHLRNLQGSDAERLARDGWLRGSYYHSDAGNALDFLGSATDSLFGYLFANSSVGTWMICAFLLGIGLFLWRRTGAPETPRIAVLPVVLPLLATYAAAMLSLYPYSGSRHDAFLSVFVAAGVALAFAFITQGRVLLLLLAAVFLVPQWRASAQHHYLDDFPESSKVEQMQGALDYLRTRSPHPGVLLVDQFGAAMVNYYVCQGVTSDWRQLSPDLNTYICGDYRVVSVAQWFAPLNVFSDALVHATKLAPDLLPDPAWVFFMSPSPLAPNLVREETRGLFGKIGVYRISPR